MFDDEEKSETDIAKGMHCWVPLSVWLIQMGHSPADFKHVTNINEYVHFFEDEVHAVSDCREECAVLTCVGNVECAPLTNLPS